MTVAAISYQDLIHALQLRDLTDPLQGKHAMQTLVDAMVRSLNHRWHCRCRVHRQGPVVRVIDNYDRLGYPADGAARDARYTRYLSESLLLRTQMSAHIPDLLCGLAIDPGDDDLLICPGLVYRRDAIDRLHTGEPHQVDLWRIKRDRLTKNDLLNMIDTVVTSVLPGYRYRVVGASHPYTEQGLQIDVHATGRWVEIGECGLASPAVLRDAGLDTGVYTGLAMGLGLDRLLMLRKDIDDIRLLRSDDPRVADQMLDLDPYKPVSHQPAISRDLSVAVDQHLTEEILGDRIRHAMVEDTDWLESVHIMDETPYGALPAAAHERMGMSPDQKNVLIRLVIRHPVKSLTQREANVIRDRVYTVIHEGGRRELTGAQ